MVCHTEDAARVGRKIALKAAVIINPVSGTGGRPELARRRVEQAAAIMEARKVEGQLFVTERPGHAKELARAAIAQRCTTIVAWGGDGTVNEVASAAAFGNAMLAIIPSGSGNGLARDLQIPFDPARALRVAMEGAARAIDAGELDGHLFFNIAGIGLDARVAHRFAEDGLAHRGFKRYLAITLKELFTYEPADLTIVTDGQSVRARALLVAIANARQYGNGALIAPSARVDDGKLEVVVVDYRPPWRTVCQIPRLFMGQIARVPGVSSQPAEEIEVTSNAPMLYHVDGEPRLGGASLKAHVCPRALRVIVPRESLTPQD